MRLLTTKKERQIRMTQLKPVSKKAKILFSIDGLSDDALLLLPTAAPLVGMFCLGNLMRERCVCG